MNELPFSKHQERYKNQVMMAYKTDMNVQGDEEETPELEPDLDHIVNRCKTCLSLKYFMIRWTSTQKRLAITIAIIELANSSRDSSLAQRRLRGRN